MRRLWCSRRGDCDYSCMCVYYWRVFCIETLTHILYNSKFHFLNRVNYCSFVIVHNDCNWTLSRVVMSSNAIVWIDIILNELAYCILYSNFWQCLINVKNNAIRFLKIGILTMRIIMWSMILTLVWQCDNKSTFFI